MISEEDRIEPVILAWFPLVVRPRPPGLPLEARISELTALTTVPAAGTAHERASRAAEVLNKAALITSDCAMPALARSLCHRQRELFDHATPLPSWATRLGLQPILNIPRQLIREGQGQDAYAMLETLYQAARHRASTVIDGQAIDLGAITRAPDDHKTVCTLIWAALLADGTRALAQAGRWKEAADLASAHRGAGRRLLDGRQATIIALLHDGQPAKAAAAARHAAITEPWEQAVQALLQVLCQRWANGRRDSKAAITMLSASLALAEQHDPSTALARARIGMTALDLAGSGHAWQSRPLRVALIASAAGDAYIARDMLARHEADQSLRSAERQGLDNTLHTSGLGAGTIPERLYRQLTAAVDCAETTLKNELDRTCH
jgi:hypothetical protein